jgi:hypothetical protein
MRRARLEGPAVRLADLTLPQILSLLLAWAPPKPWEPFRTPASDPWRTWDDFLAIFLAVRDELRLRFPDRPLFGDVVLAYRATHGAARLTPDSREVDAPTSESARLDDATLDEITSGQ